MRNMMRSRVLSVAVMGSVMLGLLVSPVAAEVITQSVDNCSLSGVDAAGNPSGSGQGPGKLYKYTNLKLVVLVCHAFVPNLSGRPAVFRNQGCGLFDPQTLIAYAADRDLEVVAKPFGTTQAFATLVCVKKVP